MPQLRAARTRDRLALMVLSTSTSITTTTAQRSKEQHDAHAERRVDDHRVVSWRLLVVTVRIQCGYTFVSLLDARRDRRPPQRYESLDKKTSAWIPPSVDAGCPHKKRDRRPDSRTPAP